MEIMFGNVANNLFFSGHEIIFKVYFLLYVHECFVCMAMYHTCTVLRSVGFP